MIEALGYLVLAGVMNSAYTLPLKLKLCWKWENMWLAFTVFGVCVLPMALGWLTIPDFWTIYGQIHVHSLLIVCFSGVTWGVALLLFGVAVDSIGVALTFAIVMGTSAGVGSCLPLLVKGTEGVSPRSGMLIGLGIALTVLGVVLCGAAGRQRERDEAGKDRLVTKLGFLRGFILAISSGIAGSMLNLGLAAGFPLIEAAREHGASARMSVNAAWTTVLFAGAVPGIIYCVYLLKKNNSGKNFFRFSTVPYWLLGILMGILWFGSVVLYGWATLRIGGLGEVVGWPLFMVTIVLGSSLWGVLTGEWRNTGIKAQILMGLAVLVLIMAMGVLASTKAANEQSLSRSFIFLHTAMS